MLTNVHTQHLLEGKGDLGDSDLAQTVVNMDFAFNSLVSRQYILLQLGCQSCDSLVENTPCLYIYQLFHFRINLHIVRLFSHDKHLLVDHVVLKIIALYRRLDVILDFGFGFELCFPFIVKTGRSIFRQSKLEFYLIAARLKFIRQITEPVPILQKLVRVF